MQLQVTHTTGYSYAGRVLASYNEARMTPVTAPGQLVLASRLDVTPSPWMYRYRDYWGAQVTAFEVAEVHDRLLVTAASTVQVDRRPAEPHGLTWDELRDPAVVDRQCEYLGLPPRVLPALDLAERLGPLLADASGPSDFAQAACHLVHSEVEYVTGSSEVHSTAAEAWDARAGVCQDVAHLCIGALRTAGLPARYVSGYLHPSTDPVVAEPATGVSHSWVEWWDGTWVGFDPTNEVTPDDRYITVAAGRDYADVAPLTGIYAGDAESTMFVEVTVTRVA
jgi:transglutaminase-like putative cysteine protease